MKREQTIRDWFGAVRDAADTASECLEAPVGTVQAVKANILIRQYLCDRLAAQISEADGLSGETSDEIRKEIYSELMEDAIAGVWSETESMETTVFLCECSNGVREKAIFDRLLQEALPESTQETAAAVRTLADQELERFAGKRKALHVPVARERNEDEPPPWLDEFEYIDWVITH